METRKSQNFGCLTVPFFSFVVLEAQMGNLREIEIFGGAPLENVQNVMTGSFEMRRRVIRAWNEDLRFRSHIRWLIHVINFDKPKKRFLKNDEKKLLFSDRS